VEDGALVVRNVGRFPTYNQVRPIDMILLGLWRWADLTFPGAYTHGGKKARINIKTGGL
jgi:hypothetical protein